MRNLPTDKIISCFYDSSQDCIKVLSPEGVLMSFNPNGLKVMEIDDERDVLGKDWLSFWKGDMQLKAAAAIKQAGEGKLARFEGYCPTFKGNLRYWEVSLAPLYDEFGLVTWLLVTSRDATRQRDLEALVSELKHENRQLQERLASVHEPV